MRCSADPEKQDNQLVPTSTKLTCSGIDLVGYAIASLVLPNHPIEGQAGTMLTCCGTDLVGQAGGRNTCNVMLIKRDMQHVDDVLCGILLASQTGTTLMCTLLLSSARRKRVLQC